MLDAEAGAAAQPLALEEPVKGGAERGPAGGLQAPAQGVQGRGGRGRAEEVPSGGWRCAMRASSTSPSTASVKRLGSWSSSSEGASGRWSPVASA